MSVPARRLTPDTSWTRVDPTALLAGSPLRLFRVTGAGCAVLDALEHGRPLPAGHAPLTDRLLAAGAVHPDLTDTADRGDAAATIDDITVVIPTFGETATDVAAVIAPLAPARAVVVDDGAAPPLDPRAFPAGIHVLRRDRNGGPGAARNLGLDVVTTPFVLFLDSDATIDRPAVELLLRHFHDERVGAVAPRVRPPLATGAGVLDRYERARSPLDMGAQPALVRAGTRVSYLPTAALLCRTGAVRQVAGFDEALRFGEDVDLVWRLADRGWAVRYEPAVVAAHAARPSLGRMLRQRYHYGTAAGALDRRHPGTLAPVRLTRWAGGAWTAIVAGHPLLGTTLAAAGTAPLARQLAGAGPAGWRATARVAASGTLHGGRQLADAAVSVWLPVTVLAALASRRARRAAVAAVTVPAAVEWLQRCPQLDPLRFATLRTLDRAAYGLGVIRGALAARTPGPLVPAIH